MTKKMLVLPPYLPERLVYSIRCKDEFEMSVQASYFHYSSHKDECYSYTNVEIGYPSAIEDLIIEYAENKSKPTKTVYVHVPIEIVIEVIEKHGGLHEDCLAKIVEIGE